MKHRQALLCMALLLGACGQKPPPDAPVAKPPLPLAELGYAAMQAGNYVEAHDIWRTRAAAGDAEGQYNLGWLFHNGYGQAINDQQAAYWWQQAAGQGHVDSHLALAKLYQLGGRNFKPDLSLALPHLAVAVAADDEEARILFRLLLAKGGKAVQQALPEIIRQSPAALGAERFVGAEQAR